mmetsp:Transcript_87617/g.253016  ORF Transcript_87617/g.253016 Transcript_87617/m.253016 type:complete len:234 (-) Transcript_87617:212-913(-)
MANRMERLAERLLPTLRESSAGSALGLLFSPIAARVGVALRIGNRRRRRRTRHTACPSIRCEVPRLDAPCIKLISALSKEIVSKEIRGAEGAVSICGVAPCRRTRRLLRQSIEIGIASCQSKRMKLQLSFVQQLRWATTSSNPRGIQLLVVFVVIRLEQWRQAVCLSATCITWSNRHSLTKMAIGEEPLGHLGLEASRRVVNRIPRPMPKYQVHGDECQPVGLKLRLRQWPRH